MTLLLSIFLVCGLVGTITFVYINRQEIKELQQELKELKELE